MTHIREGQVARNRVRFWAVSESGAKTLADPASVRITIKPPVGGEQHFTYAEDAGPISRESTGIYLVDHHTRGLSGDWEGEWYAIGLLDKGWKAKANQDLVASLREQMAGFPHVKLVKVAGHAGVDNNERCDQLARQAITSRHEV